MWCCHTCDAWWLRGKKARQHQLQQPQHIVASHPPEPPSPPPSPKPDTIPVEPWLAGSLELAPRWRWFPGTNELYHFLFTDWIRESLDTPYPECRFPRPEVMYWPESKWFIHIPTRTHARELNQLPL